MQKVILYLNEYSELINEIVQLKEINIFIEKYNKEVSLDVWFKNVLEEINTFIKNYRYSKYFKI